MVEKQSSCMEWEGPTPSIHRSYHRDRCIPQRVGGPLPRHLHWGTMAQARKPIPYNLPRTSSRIPSRPVFHKEIGKGLGTAAYGQCNSSNLYKQDGGHPLPYPVTVSQEPLGLVSKSQCFDKGTVHSRNPECTSRSRV